jgi:hypothetical protein
LKENLQAKGKFAHAHKTDIINKLFHYYSIICTENTEIEVPVLCLVLNVYDVILTRRSVYSEPEDGKYGNQDENGTWGGIVGMIVRGESDVGMNVLAFSTERISSIAFLQPIWNSKYTNSS